MSYPLYLSQFRTSEISGYTRILLRAIQKRAELAALRQQHFLYQRKIVYNPISLRSSSGETDTEDNHRQFFPYWSFLFLFQLHWTLLWVVCRGSRWQWKQEMRKVRGINFFYKVC